MGGPYCLRFHSAPLILNHTISYRMIHKLSISFKTQFMTCTSIGNLGTATGPVGPHPPHGGVEGRRPRKNLRVCPPLLKENFIFTPCCCCCGMFIFRVLNGSKCRSCVQNNLNCPGRKQPRKSHHNHTKMNIMCP